jgi:hypothetical protein
MKRPSGDHAGVPARESISRTRRDRTCMTLSAVSMKSSCVPSGDHERLPTVPILTLGASSS